MGINVYVSYQVVGYRGTGAVSYQQALALIFVEGLFFIAISVTGLRGRLIELVPKHIMLATSCGIGLFLAHIGLQSAEGIGLVTADGATLVALGGCPHANRVHYYFIKDPSPEAVCVPGPDGTMTANLGPKSSNYGCKGKRMHSPTMMLGIWSAGLIIVLMYYEVKAAIMFGVVFATAISWIPGTAVSYLSASGDIPGGAERFDFFKKVVDVPNPSKTAGLLDFSFVYNGQAWVAFLTLIYLDFLGERFEWWFYEGGGHSSASFFFFAAPARRSANSTKLFRSPPFPPTK
jgi:AGZA family xanthine/uracil permease-like MFS transporter